MYFSLTCLRLITGSLETETVLGLQGVPVNPKGNQSCIFIGRTDAEAETPILWPPDVKNWLIGKDLDAGKDWRQEEKGMTEDETVGWHHQFNGMSLSKLWELMIDRVTKSWRRLNDWTELNWILFITAPKVETAQTSISWLTNRQILVYCSVDCDSTSKCNKVLISRTKG